MNRKTVGPHCQLDAEKKVHKKCLGLQTCLAYRSSFFSERRASDSRWQCEMGNLSVGGDFLEISP